ncbi:hypothetical protein D3C84_915280 [compost metagenome]
MAGSYGQVGTYGFLVLTTENGQDVVAGEVYPGSSLSWGSGAGGSYGSPTGSWKCLGYVHTSADDRHDDVTLWIRIA